ncbi:hypothetical protein BKA59DRAFT_515526 [Fusarium tricinctum]|uniref:RBR-type E3 ubiquitin transferase n=1 Tax=Fusarium tricinctum TaxID=61284 RepID=A0A8K0RUJ8_9HYPO|nr:hypothetical protein BKA59DRAFT_515526 [Fusarium tricinctum]
MEAADYALALSIAQAVEADAALIAALLEEDEQRERDLNFARRLQQDPGARHTQHHTDNDARHEQLDDEDFETLRRFNIAALATGGVLPEVDDTTIVNDDVAGNRDDGSEIDDSLHSQDSTPGQDHDIGQNINHGEGPDAESESEQTPEEAPGTEPETDPLQEEESEELEDEEPPVDTEAEPEQVESPIGNPSILATTPFPPAPVPETTECISCSDELIKPELFESSCSHSICRTCLPNWIETSLRDESSFPLKCCGQIIPITLDNPLISEEQFDAYEARRVELETPRRTYCSDTTCAAFIPLRSIEAGIARCLHCEKQTCVECKMERHAGVCIKSEEDQTREVFAMAEVAGWRQCAQCHHMVSLITGCNHISCLCGFQFCYVCGERWKTCRCPHFDEANLFNRADEFAAGRRRVARNAVPPGRAIFIYAAMSNQDTNTADTLDTPR